MIRIIFKETRRGSSRSNSDPIIKTGGKSVVWDKWSPAAVGSSRGSRVAGAAGGGVQRAPLHRTLLVLLEGRQGGDCPEGRGAGGQGAKSRAQRGSSGSASGGINLIGFNPCKTPLLTPCSSQSPDQQLCLSPSRIVLAFGILLLILVLSLALSCLLWMKARRKSLPRPRAPVHRMQPQPWVVPHSRQPYIRVQI